MIVNALEVSLSGWRAISKDEEGVGEEKQCASRLSRAGT